jgi:precorrin-4 methylase
MASSFFAAGCDDGTHFSSGGKVAISFSREAKNMEEAVRSAIRNVQQAGFAVARVESADQPFFSRINEELARR